MPSKKKKEKEEPIDPTDYESLIERLRKMEASLHFLEDSFSELEDKVCDLKHETERLERLR